jgi:hypothetical protein
MSCRNGHPRHTGDLSQDLGVSTLPYNAVHVPHGDYGSHSVATVQPKKEILNWDLPYIVNKNRTVAAWQH